MSLANAEAFVTLIRERLGRHPVLYGGRHLREACAGVERSVLADCPLWYARFAPEPKGVPPLWPRWTLWQYTDGASGPEPHEVDGIGPATATFQRNGSRVFRALAVLNAAPTSPPKSRDP